MAKQFNLFTIPDSSVFYRDLRQQQDDKTVLENPHKGWYIHYIDNGARQDTYRTDIASPEMLKALPGTKFLYLRLDWSDIEKDDGQFDFSLVDNIFDQFAPYGFKFIFRFCCFEGGGKLAYATPKFVFDAGAAGTPVNDDMEPDYGDPVFLRYVERFLAECGKKYNGHPLVESVDVGTIGTWGEGHTWMGSRRPIPAEVHKKHIDLHLRYFNRTQVTLNYSACVFTQKQDPEASKRLTDYCSGLGMALRCDSLNVESYIYDFGYNTLCTPDLFGIFSERAPIDIEFEHYRLTGAPKFFRGGYPHLDALRQVKATYAGFHGYVTKWIEEQPYLHEYLANRLGYWYFIEGFSLPPIPSGAHGCLDLRVDNRGFARAYHEYAVRIILENETGRYEVCNAPGGNTLWHPGEVSVARYTIDVSQVPPGKYTLHFGMFEGDTPILFGMKKEFFDGLYYRLGEMAVE